MMLEKILIYSDFKQFNGFNLKPILEDLNKKFPWVFLESMVFNFADEKIKNLAEKIAKIRIIDLFPLKYNDSPLETEVHFEEKQILNRKVIPGYVYDCFKLKEIYEEEISKKNLKLNFVNIILTGRLVASFDKDDLRLHLRTCLLGVPSLISLSGVEQAPAKSKEYYLLKSIYPRLNQTMINRCYFKSDELLEIIKGLCLQAIFYQIAGEGFCTYKNCRLFNAHTQEDLRESQLEGEHEFCEKHEKLLSKMGFTFCSIKRRNAK